VQLSDPTQLRPSRAGSLRHCTHCNRSHASDFRSAFARPPPRRTLPSETRPGPFDHSRKHSQHDRHRLGCRTRHGVRASDRPVPPIDLGGGRYEDSLTLVTNKSVESVSISPCIYVSRRTCTRIRDGRILMRAYRGRDAQGLVAPMEQTLFRNSSERPRFEIDFHPLLLDHGGRDTVTCGCQHSFSIDVRLRPQALPPRRHQRPDPVYSPTTQPSADSDSMRRRLASEASRRRTAHIRKDPSCVWPSHSEDFRR